MQDLLARAIHAHGGVEHWRTLSRFRARSHVQGAIWAVKGKQGAFGELVITGGTRTQRVTIAPYPEPGRCITWEPQRQTIQQDNGVLVAEQSRPRARFDLHTRQTPWDDFHAGYFTAEVLWNLVRGGSHLAGPPRHLSGDIRHPVETADLVLRRNGPPTAYRLRDRHRRRLPHLTDRAGRQQADSWASWCR